MRKMLRLSVADYERLHPTKKQPRVKNTRRKTVNGIEFDSTREARRYQDLALMQQAGQIRGLRRQVPFAIEIKGAHICEWRADFVYEEIHKHNGETARTERYEDSKGHRTEVYLLKKKMVEAYYGIKILET